MPAHLPSRWKLFTALGVIAALLIVLDHMGLLLVPHADDMQAYDGRAVRIIRIINAQTLEIDHPDALNNRQSTRVRLWGIQASNTDEARIRTALDFARNRIADQPITLRLEAHRTRDPFGRLLAHVELPDGSCLNADLLEAAHVITEERFAHQRLQHYAQAQNLARQANR